MSIYPLLLLRLVLHSTFYDKIHAFVSLHCLLLFVCYRRFYIYEQEIHKKERMLRGGVLV